MKVVLNGIFTDRDVSCWPWGLTAMRERKEIFVVVIDCLTEDIQYDHGVVEL